MNSRRAGYGRHAGPPPVPLRLQRERFDRKDWHVEDDRHEDTRLPDVQSALKDASGGHQQLWPTREDNSYPGHGNSGGGNNSVSTRILESLEFRLRKLEHEKEQEKQATDGRISRLMEVVGRLVEDRQSAREGEQKQSQGKHDAVYQQKALDLLSDENKHLKQTIENMRQHIQSIEDVVASRNSKVERLVSGVEQLEQIKLDMAQLKGILLERENSGSSFGKDMNAAFTEISNLKHTAENQGVQIEQIRNEISARLQRLDKHLASSHESLEVSLAKESQLRQEGEKWFKTVQQSVQDLQLDGKAGKEALLEIKEYGLKSHEIIDRQVQEVREYVSQMKQSLAKTFEERMDEGFQRQAQAFTTERQERATERAEFLGRLAQLKERTDVDRKSMEERFLMLRDKTLEKDSTDQMVITEIRNEFESRFEALSRELQREETSRIDSVRRVHEDLLDQLDGFHRDGKGASGTGGAALNSVREKLAELEEVVRAEVRSRMRHETKAREHLENTAKSLQLDNDTTRKELESHVQNVQKVLDTSFATLEEQFSDKVEKVETQLVEELHSWHVSQSDNEQRISACEAKIAKTIAGYQIAVDKIELDLENRDNEVKAKLDSVSEQLKTLPESLEALKADVLHQASSSISENIYYIDSKVDQQRAELYAQIEAESQVRDAVVAECRERVSENGHIMTSSIAELRDFVSLNEAKTASEGALDSILLEIERQEAEEQFASERKQFEEGMRHFIESSLSGFENEFTSKLLLLQAEKNDAAVKFEQFREQASYDLASVKRQLLQNVEDLKDSSRNAELKFEILESEFQTQKSELQNIVESVQADLQVQQAMDKIAASIFEKDMISKHDKLSEEFSLATHHASDALEDIFKAHEEEKERVSTIQSKLQQFIAKSEHEKEEEKMTWESIEKAQGFLDLDIDFTENKMLDDGIKKLDESKSKEVSLAASQEINPASNSSVHKTEEKEDTNFKDQTGKNMQHQQDGPRQTEDDEFLDEDEFKLE